MGIIIQFSVLPVLPIVPTILAWLGQLLSLVNWPSVLTVLTIFYKNSAYNARIGAERSSLKNG